MTVFKFKLGDNRGWAQSHKTTITLALASGTFPSTLDLQISLTAAEAREMADALEKAAEMTDPRTVTADDLGLLETMP